MIKIPIKCASLMVMLASCICAVKGDVYSSEYNKHIYIRSVSLKGKIVPNYFFTVYCVDNNSSNPQEKIEKKCGSGSTDDEGFGKIILPSYVANNSIIILKSDELPILSPSVGRIKVQFRQYNESNPLQVVIECISCELKYRDIDKVVMKILDNKDPVPNLANIEHILLSTLQQLYKSSKSDVEHDFIVWLKTSSTSDTCNGRKIKQIHNIISAKSENLKHHHKDKYESLMQECSSFYKEEYANGRELLDTKYISNITSNTLMDFNFYVNTSNIVGCYNSLKDAIAEIHRVAENNKDIKQTSIYKESVIKLQFISAYIKVIQYQEFENLTITNKETPRTQHRKDLYLQAKEQSSDLLRMIVELKAANNIYEQVAKAQLSYLDMLYFKSFKFSNVSSGLTDYFNTLKNGSSKVVKTSDKFMLDYIGYYLLTSFYTYQIGLMIEAEYQESNNKDMHTNASKVYKNAFSQIDLLLNDLTVEESNSDLIASVIIFQAGMVYFAINDDMVDEPVQVIESTIKHGELLLQKRLKSSSKLNLKLVLAKMYDLKQREQDDSFNKLLLLSKSIDYYRSVVYSCSILSNQKLSYCSGIFEGYKYVLRDLHNIVSQFNDPTFKTGKVSINIVKLYNETVDSLKEVARINFRNADLNNKQDYSSKLNEYLYALFLYNSKRVSYYKYGRMIKTIINVMKVNTVDVDVENYKSLLAEYNNAVLYSDGGQDEEKEIKKQIILKNKKDIIALFENATKLVEDKETERYVVLADALASIYYHSKDYNKAKVMLTDLHLVVPNNRNIYSNLMNVLSEKLLDFRSAYKINNQWVKNNPSDYIAKIGLFIRSIELHKEESVAVNIPPLVIQILDKIKELELSTSSNKPENFNNRSVENGTNLDDIFNKLDDHSVGVFVITLCIFNNIMFERQPESHLNQCNELLSIDDYPEVGWSFSGVIAYLSSIKPRNANLTRYIQILKQISSDSTSYLLYDAPELFQPRL